MTVGKLTSYKQPTFLFGLQFSLKFVFEDVWRIHATKADQKAVVEQRRIRTRLFNYDGSAFCWLRRTRLWRPLTLLTDGASCWVMNLFNHEVIAINTGTTFPQWVRDLLSLVCRAEINEKQIFRCWATVFWCIFVQRLLIDLPLLHGCIVFL